MNLENYNHSSVQRKLKRTVKERNGQTIHQNDYLWYVQRALFSDGLWQLGVAPP